MTMSWNPASLFNSSVSLGKSLTLSESQIPHLWRGDNNGKSSFSCEDEVKSCTLTSWHSAWQVGSTQCVGSYTRNHHEQFRLNRNAEKKVKSILFDHRILLSIPGLSGLGWPLGPLVLKRTMCSSLFPRQAFTPSHFSPHCFPGEFLFLLTACPTEVKREPLLLQNSPDIFILHRFSTARSH